MSDDSKSTPRVLQQQPSREIDREQQRAGATDFQQQQAGQQSGEREQQMGEGSYEATADYQRNIKEYLEKADVGADAKAAKPRSEAEAHALEEAEREGRSHSKGEN
jgi:hypothetical protein